MLQHHIKDIYADTVTQDIGTRHGNKLRQQYTKTIVAQQQQHDNSNAITVTQQQ